MRVPKFKSAELASITEAYHTGRELVDAGLLEDAIRYFDEVLRRLPRRRRDRTYRIARDAAQRSQGVLWLPPVFRDALLAKAFCLNELGLLEDAFVLLQRAAELDPENPQIYAELGFTFSSQDNLADARAAYLHAVELEPKNPAFQCALAHIALLEDRFEEARERATIALEADENSVQAMHQLAFAEYRLGRLEEAIRVLERACALAPEDAENVRRLAMVLHESGRSREAIDFMHAYLRESEGDPELLGLLTELLQQGGASDEMIGHARRILESNPRDAAAMDLLAWGNYQQGNLAEARTVLAQLVQLYPDQAFHHFKLGVILQALGELKAAMVSFLRATALDPDGEMARMSNDAISVLDRVQIEQIVRRAKHDAPFRYRLQRELELVLHQTGYLLSPLGLMLLQTVDYTEELPEEVEGLTVH